MNYLLVILEITGMYILKHICIFMGKVGKIEAMGHTYGGINGVSQ
jgi:hypothetical protein